MAGIQISGLLSNQAFDWKSVVDQLIEVSKVPVKKLEFEKATNANKSSALGEVKSSMQALQEAVQAIRANNTFKQRSVTSSDSTTTWKSSSAVGAPIGSYKFTVDALATASTLKGGALLAKPLAPDAAGLSALTMNNLPLASKLNSGTQFTVNGTAITFDPTESLDVVLNRITAETGVNWSYDSAADRITLDNGASPLVLGAANDSSNFLTALKLSNSVPASSTSTSSGRLAVLSTTATLENARLGAWSSGPIGVDGSGVGSFTINGQTITYDVDTDSLNTILDRINKSTAEVSAMYDAANDRVVLTNKKTGNLGVFVSEAAPGLLEALKLTTVSGSTLETGADLKYRVNDGDWIYSSSNTIESGSHGITGLSVTVNTIGTQTLSVQSDGTAMRTAIEDVIEKFNSFQDLIENVTRIDTAGGKTTASVLSDNREIQSWARELHKTVFATLTGIDGSIDHIDDFGIDFDGITGHLKIKNEGRLNAVFSERPEHLDNFFLSGERGMVNKLYTVLTKYMSDGTQQQDRLTQASSDLDEQIAALNARIEQERETLTNSFIRMLEAQSAAQSQSSAITNAFFKKNSD